MLKLSFLPSLILKIRRLAQPRLRLERALTLCPVYRFAAGSLRLGRAEAADELFGTVVSGSRQRSRGVRIHSMVAKAPATTSATAATMRSDFGGACGGWLRIAWAGHRCLYQCLTENRPAMRRGGGDSNHWAFRSDRDNRFVRPDQPGAMLATPGSRQSTSRCCGRGSRPGSCIRPVALKRVTNFSSASAGRSIRRQAGSCRKCNGLGRFHLLQARVPFDHAPSTRSLPSTPRLRRTRRWRRSSRVDQQPHFLRHVRCCETSNTPGEVGAKRLADESPGVDPLCASTSVTFRRGFPRPAGCAVSPGQDDVVAA